MMVLLTGSVEVISKKKIKFFFLDFLEVFFFLFQVKMFPVTSKSLRKVMMKMMFVLIHLNEMMMTMSPQVKIVTMRVMMTG